MATFNYQRSRLIADKQIHKWGNPALLRRESGDRVCWAMEAQLTATEKNAMKNFKQRIYLISATDLAIAPGKEDALITYVVDSNGDNTTTENPPLRQVAPVNPLAPGGYVVYYELTVE